MNDNTQMTREDITELWHKVWPDSGAFVRASAEDLERFAALVAALVAAAEREACAKACEEVGQHNIVNQCITAIRARGVV